MDVLELIRNGSHFPQPVAGKKLQAGLLPLDKVMEKSGTTQWLANQLLSVGIHLPSFWVLVFFYVATTLLTEILSNKAVVVLMIPIAAEVGKTLGLNLLAFIYAVTFVASNSYLTPIGSQTNTMVYGLGGYKFLDFTRVGATPEPDFDSVNILPDCVAL